VVIERGAAVRQLQRRLGRIQVGYRTTIGHLEIAPGSGSGIWHAVYHFHGEGFACWDFYPSAKDPGPSRYGRRVSDRLLTTDKVVERVRRMKG
jgi:hypothetical protein